LKRINKTSRLSTHDNNCAYSTQFLLHRFIIKLVAHGPAGPGNFLNQEWQDHLSKPDSELQPNVYPTPIECADTRKNVLSRLRFPESGMFGEGVGEKSEREREREN